MHVSAWKGTNHRLSVTGLRTFVPAYDIDIGRQQQIFHDLKRCCKIIVIVNRGGDFFDEALFRMKRKGTPLLLEDATRRRASKLRKANINSAAFFHLK